MLYSVNTLNNFVLLLCVLLYDDSCEYCDDKLDGVCWWWCLDVVMISLFLLLLLLLFYLLLMYLSLLLLLLFLLLLTTFPERILPNMLAAFYSLSSSPLFLSDTKLLLLLLSDYTSYIPLLSFILFLSPLLPFTNYPYCYYSPSCYY